MGASPYGDGTADNQYKTVAQIWQEASEQGANYRTLSAKHRYNVVKNCSGDDFIPENELKKVKSVGRGSFAYGMVFVVSLLDDLSRHLLTGTLTAQDGLLCS